MPKISGRSLPALAPTKGGEGGGGKDQFKANSTRLKKRGKTITSCFPSHSTPPPPPPLLPSTHVGGAVARTQCLGCVGGAAQGRVAPCASARLGAALEDGRSQARERGGSRGGEGGQAGPGVGAALDSRSTGALLAPCRAPGSLVQPTRLPPASTLPPPPLPPPLLFSYSAARTVPAVEGRIPGRLSGDPTRGA